MDLESAKAKLTVVIPVRQKSSTIKYALQSLLDQSFEDWVVIGLLDRDDGSIARIFSEMIPENKLRLLSVDVSAQGLGLVRAEGVNHTETPYIAMLDCDDVSLPDRFEKQISLISSDKKIGLVAGAADVMDTFGNLKYRLSTPELSFEIKNALLKENCIVQSAVMLRKSSILEAGNYLSNTHGCEDYDLWLRMITVCDFAATPETVVKYLINPVAVTRKKIPKASKRQLNKSKRMAQKFLKIGFLRRNQQNLLWNAKEFASDLLKLRFKFPF